MAGLTEPWSKKHKRNTKASAGGLKFSLSNSFAQPITMPELLELSSARGDQEIIDMYSNHALGYTPNGGSLDLRDEISNLYGPNITANHILVCTGAQIALQTAAFALASDCHTIVFTPGYQSTVEASAHAGGSVTQIGLKASNEWQIQIEDVKAAIQANTRYMVLNEPYNPAGTLMSKALQAELVALAEAHDIRILCDEVYRFMEHDPSDRLPAMCDTYSKGISVGTMSKPWGAGGVAIGWLAFQDLSVRQKLVDVQYFNTACPSRASEIQAVMVLRASDTILAKNLSIIRHNLEVLESFMTRYSDFFDWVRPRAGAIAALKFKGSLSSEELGAQLVAAGIGVKPAYCVSDYIDADNDFFRVGFGELVAPDALQALEVFVEEHRKSWKGFSHN